MYTYMPIGIFRVLIRIGQPQTSIGAGWQLLKRLGYRPTIWVLENKGIFKFLGGVFPGREVYISPQGYPYGIFWELHVPILC